jgi:3',5'-nucleoside bisphosphate phosphatase
MNENLIRTDLHNHSCLSPCGSLEMSPAVLVRGAAARGIDILALTDHNSTRNLPAFAVCCRRAGITPVFGLEVNTVEEVHVLCLFRELEQAEHFGSIIESTLPDIANVPDIFGDQVIVDPDEQVLGFVDISLFSSSSISFFDLIPMVLNKGGLVIPAHIDRPGNGAVSQLGFLPDLPYSAVEFLSLPPAEEIYGSTVITGSDAHDPASIGRRSFFITGHKEPTFESLSKALRNGEVN